MLRVGDPIRLSFKLQRKNQGRSEELTVNGEARVSRIGVDTTKASGCLQVVMADWIGTPPAWKAIKRPLPRVLSPARSPATQVR